MTQAQERTAVQPAIVRSEQFVDRIGQSIGSFAALTRQRVQQTAMHIGESVASGQTELAAQAAQSKQPNQTAGMPQAGMQRAERVVDDMGQRLALLASRVGLQIRKMAAYAREGAEDIWVEAQHTARGRGSTGK